MEEEKSVQTWHHVVTVEELEGLNRKIQIVYDSIGVGMAFEKACDNVVKQAQVKGYRKGKAPRSLVKTRCQEQVKNTASNMLINEGFLHACYEQKIHPLDKPRVEDIKFGVDGTFSCTVYVEVKPTIIPSGYVGMQLTKTNIDPEELFKLFLEEEKQKHASTVDKEIVEENNTVEVDFIVRCEGAEIAAGSNHQFLITSQIEPPFGSNLLGMRVGECREADYTVPDSFNQYVGKQAKVSIILKTVKTQVPPTNEELAERMKVATYDELETMFREKAKVEAQNRERQTYEEMIVDKLVETHQFEVPLKWVDNEIEYMVKQFGIDITKDEKLYNYIKNMAERNVRRAFIVDSIYEGEPSLAIKQEEMEELITKESERTGASILEIKNHLKKPNVLDSVLGMMRQRKVMDLILSQAQVAGEKSSPEVTEIPENPLG